MTGERFVAVYVCFQHSGNYIIGGVAFVRAFRHDMQSPEGMKILKLLLDEVCETFDVPYLHIGTDEVDFCKKHQMLLIPEIDMPGHSAAFVRAFRHDILDQIRLHLSQI